MISTLLWVLFFHRCFHLTSAYSEKRYDFSVVEGKPGSLRASLYGLLLESPKNSSVGQISLNPNEKYRISAPNPSIKDLFYIDFTNGNIRTLNRIDRDTLQLYNNTVDLIVISQSASLISIHIHVLDINDNAPIFLQQFYVCSAFLNLSFISPYRISASLKAQLLVAVFRFKLRRIQISE